MKTDWWASGTHFLPFSLIAGNCYQWKQIFIKLEHIGNVETKFLSVLSIVLFQLFFCKWKPLLKLGRSPFWKTNHIPASGNQIFIFFRYFLKWKQLFRTVETYFSISFNLLVQMDFLPSANSVFWSVLFHC